MPTHYQTLGVDPKATDDEVRKAFYAVAKVYHPDAAPSLSESCEPRVSFEDAEAAYAGLKTPAKRAAYDAKLLALAPKCPRCKGAKTIQKMSGWKAEEQPCPECGGTGKKV
jgi:DnaJ-class molecular chaperone